ncbi:MAG: 1-acyl-sn-glycerol-3-phosphate acyltransferase [Bacteroidales bacterium]|nr:1-acyl-sn-glycerol-3-phosphate acyltransferase [Bacteroidales bacterium]MDD3521340.1 1-acyl-sn-glycerol-3-phosphate acyltransferase [Bacteroidales bacterium]MDD4030596.1 1-acyl-sn-glycerol-3-phosphate acyltransferase [Bacteroidales bacterium]MDD4434715.1 1-acyl-sn-glycerol-3-phosphate acyltransferase [Bacteroidales bacterium]MDD5732173.1 1-acyl-sn-glycerol-3-phosphate acyltransferase [Bacteroidales bacterium]
MTELYKDNKYIDIEKTIRESNSELLARIPPYAIKWIQSIVKQDEINHILNKYSGYSGKEFLDKIIKEFNVTIEVEGKENLPENGKCFFVANHPYGILDGLILTYIVSGKYGRLKAIANDAFMLIPQLHPFIAAVNVYDRSSKAYIKALDDTIAMDIPITHFPAGEVSRVYDKKIQDTAWHKSFIKKAISSDRAIIPIYICGRNSVLFYTVFLFRRLFHIEVNLELMLLPREIFKKRNKTVKVIIGEPIPHQMFVKTTSHRDWAQEVRSRVYNLRNIN